MNKHKFLLIAVLLLLVSAMLAGCAQNNTKGSSVAEDSGKMTIICTLFPQYDFARSIAGDTANVVMLLSPGMEAHMYDPTPSDMREISGSHLFIYTGEAMESWADEIVDSLDAHVRVLDLSQHVNLREEAEDTHEHEGHQHDGGYDPHYWLDMNNSIDMVEAIGETMKELMPEYASEYEQRIEDYVNQLTALDKAFENVVNISSRNEIVFGGRFAYSYFISRYGLEYETVYHSCSAEADPSVSDMIRVIDFIKDHGNKYIFYEELSNGTVAKTVAQDTGIKTAVFTTGHNVTKDEFESGMTFIDLMNRNLEVLKTALAR